MFVYIKDNIAFVMSTTRSLLLLLMVNGLSSMQEEQSSGSGHIGSVHDRLSKLEQTVSKIQLENAALKEELNKAKVDVQSDTVLKQIETNLTLLEDSIKELQAINIGIQQKLIILQDELWASRNETAAVVSLLHRNITMQFVDNITAMQYSIKLLRENVTFLLNNSSMHGARLAELTQLGSTLQSLIATMESRHLQLESVVSNNNSWVHRRLNEVDKRLNTSTIQLIKKNRRQDKNFKKMSKQVTGLKQQVDKLSLNDTVTTATGTYVHAYNYILRIILYVATYLTHDYI